MVFPSVTTRKYWSSSFLAISLHFNFEKIHALYIIYTYKRSSHYQIHRNVREKNIFIINNPRAELSSQKIRETPKGKQKGFQTRAGL